MRSCNFIVKSGFSTRLRWLFRIIFVNITPINYLFSTLVVSYFLNPWICFFPSNPACYLFRHLRKRTLTVLLSLFSRKYGVSMIQVVEIIGNVNRHQVMGSCRQWPFCITGQHRFPICLSIRLNKSKDTVKFRK